MKKRIIGCLLVGILMLTALIPIAGTAGDPDDPEITDRRFDVKIFGLFSGLPQSFVKHIDVVSAWFEEESDNPDYLTICLKTRSLRERTEVFEAIYRVDWIFTHEEYGVALKIHTDGIFAGFMVYTNRGEGQDNIHMCEGTFDVEQSMITWTVPKETIGDPDPGSLLTTTSACALLRPWDETTGKPGPDVFKDLTNRLMGPIEDRFGKDYRIKY